MHCPRCGHERISEETSFCSRCGLLLDFIAEVTANGGMPLYPAGGSEPKGIFTRRNGLILALIWFLLFILILTPLFAILEKNEDMIVVTGFFGTMGAIIMAVVAMFLPGRQKIREDGRYDGGKHFTSKKSRKGLPPDRTEFADDYASQRETAERGFDTEAFARPPSVTESTTKLLNKEEER